MKQPKKLKTSDLSIYIREKYVVMLDEIAIKMTVDRHQPTDRKEAARIIIESEYTKWFPPPPLDNAI